MTTAKSLASLATALLLASACGGDAYLQVWVTNNRDADVNVIDEGVFVGSGGSFVVRVAYVVPAHATRLVIDGHGGPPSLTVVTDTCEPIGNVPLNSERLATLVVGDRVEIERHAPPDAANSTFGQQTESCT